MTAVLRDLKTLDDCRAVVDLQVAVWGHDMETVPAGVLLVSAKRGGILIGAEAGGRLVGFVWSMPGMRGALHTQWSHMLAVLPECRAQGLGEALKLEQRMRALSQGRRLIEWTFDPLQAANAHLNFVVLGAVASEYLENVYGELSGPLHRGTPTDRLIAEWWIESPEVERRLAFRPAAGTAPAREAVGAPRAITTSRAGEWSTPDHVAPDLSAPVVRIPVPTRFGELQRRDTDLALSWRLATRRAFLAYFGRRYRAVDFVLDRETGSGDYVLAVGDHPDAG